MICIAYEEGSNLENGEKFFIYDIALIKVDKEWISQSGKPPSTIVKPICLDNYVPQDQKDPEFTIVGMGRIRQISKKSPKPIDPNKLQYAKMKVVPAKKCFKSYHPKLKNKPLPEDFTESTKRGFCLKGMKKETPCAGDSGAPAFWYDKKGEAYLSGIMYIGN